MADLQPNNAPRRRHWWQVTAVVFFLVALVFGMAILRDLRFDAYDTESTILAIAAIALTICSIGLLVLSRKRSGE